MLSPGKRRGEDDQCALAPPDPADASASDDAGALSVDIVILRAGAFAVSFVCIPILPTDRRCTAGAKPGLGS